MQSQMHHEDWKEGSPVKMGQEGASAYSAFLWANMPSVLVPFPLRNIVHLPVLKYNTALEFITGHCVYIYCSHLTPHGNVKISYHKRKKVNIKQHRNI